MFGRAFLTGAILLGSASAMAQKFQSIIISMDPVDVASAPAEIPIVVGLNRAGATTARVFSTLKKTGSKYNEFVRLPYEVKLDDLRSITVAIRLLNGAPQKLAVNKPVIAPLLYETGIPTQFLFASAASSMSDRMQPINTVMGLPFIKYVTGENPLDLSMAKPMTFTFKREGQGDQELIQMLQVKTEMFDGARKDTDCRMFMETYDGQLVPLQVGVGDGIKTDKTVRLNHPILPTDYKQIHIFTTHRKFEDGSALPGPGAFDGGDDMRFGIDLNVPTTLGMGNLSIGNRASKSTMPRDASMRTAAHTQMVNRLAIWMETGEARRINYLDPVLDIDLVGGKRLSIRINGGLTHSHQMPGYDARNVFSRNLPLPLAGIKAATLGFPEESVKKEVGPEPDLGAIPVHAIKKITLKLVFLGSPPDGRRDWDLKGLIIAAGRSSRFDLATANDWVPLVVKPTLNKRFHASRDTGEVNDRVIEFPIDLAPLAYEQTVSTRR